MRKHISVKLVHELLQLSTSKSHDLLMRLFCGKDKVFHVFLQERCNVHSNVIKTWIFPKSVIVHFHSENRKCFLVTDHFERRDLKVLFRERYPRLLIVFVKSVLQIGTEVASKIIDSPHLVLVEQSSHRFKASRRELIHPFENKHLAFKLRPLQFHSHLQPPQFVNKFRIFLPRPR